MADPLDREFLKAKIRSDPDLPVEAGPKQHDPADVEWMARLFCIGQGVNPDQLSEWPDFHFVWEHEVPQAIRALNYMAAREEKVTTNKPPQWGKGWKAQHDAAPMTPMGK